MQGLLEETIRREILPDMSVESAQSDLPPDVKVYPGPYDPLKRERGEWEQKFDTLKKLNPNERVEAMQKLIDEARETREEVRAEYIADMNEDEAIEQWRDRKAAYDAKFQAVKKLPANERVPALKKIIEEARKEKEDYSRQIADWENDVIMAEEAMIEEYQESHPRK
jgi:acyl-CoA reductase-like NAD-dependent aldehyde dehydrogenase